ncbi:MAG: adenylate/guanylate cyclase domain-containing protein [Stenotrophobium sp.]
MEISPHVLVALVALGMGLAFLSADRHSATSRALAAGLGLIGISIFLDVSFIRDVAHAPSWSGWLALPEALAMICMLEWLLRVRRTVPMAAHMDGTFGDRVLRIGQSSAALYAIFALIWPELRVEQFVRAADTPGAFERWGFWLFAVPILVAMFNGLVGILLLLNRRPDRAEIIRVLAMAASTPFLLAGLILPLRVSAICVVLGEIIFLIGSVHYHVLQGQRGQFMSRFLSPQVAKLVNERGLASAMQENHLEITVVCCDLRGFTPYAQAHDSAQVLQVLREYYDVVGNIVADYSATIKDFAGDGVLILVGAPLPVPDQAGRALEMAQRVRIEVSRLTSKWGTRAHPLGVGIGVASGLVTVGVIGSASRLEYTAVGSAVNLASRLCEQAADQEILVDQHTVERAGVGHLQARSPMQIKGFDEAVGHYSVPVLTAG